MKFDIVPKAWRWPLAILAGGALLIMLKRNSDARPRLITAGQRV